MFLLIKKISEIRYAFVCIIKIFGPKYVAVKMENNSSINCIRSEENLAIWLTRKRK